MKCWVTVGAALVAALCAGCGTVQNFTDPQGVGPMPLGGVDRAVERFSPGSQNEGFAQALMWPVYAADVALSAVGDIVTLPLAFVMGIDAAIADYYFPKDRPREDAVPPELPRHGGDAKPMEPERIHGGII